MTTNSDLYVLEWSQRGNGFHVQPLEATLQFNRRLYADNVGTVNDYRVLIVGTQDECLAAAEASRQTLVDREERKAA